MENCGCFRGKKHEGKHKAYEKDYKPLERSGVYNFSSSSHLRIPSFGRTDVGWGCYIGRDVSIYTLSLYILLLLVLALAILLLFSLFYSTSLFFTISSERIVVPFLSEMW